MSRPDPTPAPASAFARGQAAPAPAPGAATRSAVLAAFRTLTALAIPACLVTTAAYFASQPALLAQLSPFRAHYAALLAGHVGFCLLLRRRRWAAVFAAFALFNVWAVLRPAAPPLLAAHEAAPPPLRILLANVLTSNPDPAPLLALVAAERPDLVALLEIDARWAAALRGALSAEYPHAHYEPQEDNFGLAVLSRLPLVEPRSERFVDPGLPSHAFGLQVGRHTVRVLLTHPLPPGGSTGTALRDEQLARIGEWARALPADTPKLILADLNATAWCPPLRRLLAATALRPAAAGHRLYPATWPAPVPLLRIPIDHALLDENLVCTAYRIGPAIGSDHLPVLLEVRPAAPFPP